MRFNVGDHVVVREWDDMAEEFGLTESGNIDCRKTFVKDMRHICGEELIVAFVSEGYDTDGYRLKQLSSNYILPWKFSDDMLKPLNCPQEVGQVFNADWVEDMLSEMSIGGDEM